MVSPELVVLIEILLLVREVSSDESVSTTSRVKIAFRLNRCTPHFLNPATIFNGVNARIHTTENTRRKRSH